MLVFEAVLQTLLHFAKALHNKQCTHKKWCLGGALAKQVTSFSYKAPAAVGGIAPIICERFVW